MKYKVKLYLQFIYYILFGKSEFRLSLIKRLKYAFRGGFTVNQFYLYELENNDPNDYLSEYDWFKSRRINRPYDMVLNNKFLTRELIKDLINTPETFAVKIGGQLRVMSDGSKDTLDGILQIIMLKKNVIIKPVLAGKGRGVFKISYSQKEFCINGELKNKSSVLELLSQNDNWIMCQTVEQHEYAESIYSGSANTIRIVVIRDDDNNPVIACSVHRFGTRATGAVDNASMGGLVSNIDLESGVLGEARSIKNLNHYPAHPDTGAVIEYTVIPFWQETKEKILEVSASLPYLKLIAWDVVITANGPCVIEGNASSGVNILQLWGGLRNQSLGKYLLKHGVIN